MTQDNHRPLYIKPGDVLWFTRNSFRADFVSKNLNWDICYPDKVNLIQRVLVGLFMHYCSTGRMVHGYSHRDHIGAGVILPKDFSQLEMFQGPSNLLKMLDNRVHSLIALRSETPNY